MLCVAVAFGNVHTVTTPEIMLEWHRTGSGRKRSVVAVADIYGLRQEEDLGE
jgi:hypothetical protein